MNLTEDSRKLELIDQLADAARKRVEGERGDAAARFIRQYFALVAPDDIVYTDPETLLGGALSLWNLGQTRKPGEALIRIFNPTSAVQGWELEHTVLEVVNDDMPFLVDSITSELNRRERNVHLVIHPVIGVARDADGNRLPNPDGGSRQLAESYMRFEIDQETSDEALASIRDDVARILDDVRVAVDDWRAMREKLAAALEEIDAADLPVERDEVEEAKEFLRWLDDEHFVFLGYRRYRFDSDSGRDFLQVEPETGLGILRRVLPESQRRGRTAFSEEFSRFARRPELLIVAKANSRSTVHRPVHMDRISVKRFDSEGRVIGEHRFLGLFTSTAYARSVRYIPLLRRKTSKTVERAGLAANSHSGKALVQILETLPRDEMFQISDEELFHMSLGILQLQERQRTALFVRRDVFERFISCLVYVPRDQYDSDVRERVREILEEEFNGTVTAFYTQITDSPLARVHFILKTTPGEIPNVDLKSVEHRIAQTARTWNDHLRDALVRARGEERGLTTYRRFRDAFPAGYRERFSADAAIVEIEHIEQVLASGDLYVDLYREEGEIRCKFVHRGTPLALSDVVPRLENMGFKVELAVPYEIRLPGMEDEPVRIRDFALIGSDDLDIDAIRDEFQETLLRAWNGDTEDDGFNRLVLCAGLRWHEILILRAYCKFLRQISTTFSEAYMQTTLANNAGIARLLVELFSVQFDPERESEHHRAAEIHAEIERALDAVSNVDEDRILRRYLNLIDATLRTNHYQTDANGRRKSYLSFKFESHAVREMPLPRPMFEIFVYSPRFEGVHLRGGKVARGGLRWSDRREDFRTEILGLMKAQMVKNAVIVPVGSKGGFVLKQAPPPAQREEFLAEGVECYRNFLRGLLDLTDNLVDGAVVPPPRVVRRDEDDPYLVVAADKGTATFSDIANGISAEYGFWLGDAFASGGSAGYDHKKMGITARGAWEAVKRHFRELGIDIQTTDFTVVGVGDMSGDVFGNGMLLSKHIRLVGAFNHMHIFVDPDPDPAASWEERTRLFEMPRSTWADYDASLLSEGGGVYERRSKSITISERARERFGLASTTVTPAELIQAMLRAEADLLWLGGIGTYVKASDETDSDARDRANDSVRVDADQLRVRVVGEGANLGLTQRARIEFALEGGRINTDAIDNSAGVDTSDHEVNIKILLDDAVRRGMLTLDDRLDLLVAMTEEVGSLVLRDNYLQTQAITLAESQGVSLLDRHARVMRALERAGRLDREIEFLPDDETIAERQADGVGLTRPELAVLLAYSKIAVYQELLDSDLPDDPLLVQDLLLYFPHVLRERYAELIGDHRLRREIIATFVTNSMINRVGPTFVLQIGEETGRATSDIARAYTITRDSFDLRAMWAEIEALDNVVPSSLQSSMMLEIGRLVERATRWFLRHGSSDLDITAHEHEFRPRIATLESKIEQILPKKDADAFRSRVAEREELGIPSVLARRIAALDILGSFPDIVRIARRCNEDVAEVGRLYFGLGARFEFDHLRSLAGAIAADTPWQRAAIEGIIDDLYTSQSLVVSRVLDASRDQKVDDVIDLWFATRPDHLRRTDTVLSELRTATTVDLAMLSVVARQLRAIAES